jgi:hypothetical protein
MHEGKEGTIAVVARASGKCPSKREAGCYLGAMSPSACQHPSASRLIFLRGAIRQRAQGGDEVCQSYGQSGATA